MLKQVFVFILLLPFGFIRAYFVCNNDTKIPDFDNSNKVNYDSLIKDCWVNGQFSNGLIYCEQYGEFCEEKKDTISLIKAKRLKSKFLYYLGRNNEAIVNYENLLLTLGKYDSLNKTRVYLDLGLFYAEKTEYDKALNCYNKISPTIIGQIKKRGDYYNNFAKIYYHLEDYDNNLRYAKKALKVDKERANHDGIKLSYSNLGSTYLKMKKYNLALSYLDSAKMLNRGKLNYVTQSQIQQNLFTLYSETKNIDSAFVYLNKLKHTNDLIFDQKLEEEIEELKRASKRELNLKQKVKVVDGKIAKYERQILFWAFIIGLSIISIVYYFFYRNIKEKSKLVILEQKLLRSQMTPHFIFNSLSVIQGMILNKENSKAVTYLSKFSKLIRLILENSRNKLVPLEDELEAVRNYLDLQSLQMKRTLSYIIDIDSAINANDVLVPTMLIQPFVENSIEHGFKGDIEFPEITITISSQENSIVCEILDNGIGLLQIPEQVNLNKKSVSTIITTERLILLSKEYNSEANIDVTDRSAEKMQGTRVHLTLPEITS